MGDALADFLPALTDRERAEVLAEAQRLMSRGLLDGRTAPRLGMLALGLGRPATRPQALLLYAGAADCVPLVAGSLVEPLMSATYGERLDVLARAALRLLVAREADGDPEPAQEPAAPQNATERAQGPVPGAAPEQGPGLLPAGFTIDGETLEQNALRAVVQRIHASVERRPVFAAAITAHREGRLAEWMATEPRARIDGG